MWGVCDCCWLLDGDCRTKLVTWCSLCSSWLCEPCKFDPLRRARAAMVKRWKQ